MYTMKYKADRRRKFPFHCGRQIIPPAPSFIFSLLFRKIARETRVQCVYARQQTVAQHNLHYAFRQMWFAVLRKIYRGFVDAILELREQEGRFRSLWLRWWTTWLGAFNCGIIRRNCSVLIRRAISPQIAGKMFELQNSLRFRDLSN